VVLRFRLMVKRGPRGRPSSIRRRSAAGIILLDWTCRSRRPESALWMHWSAYRPAHNSKVFGTGRPHWTVRPWGRRKEGSAPSSPSTRMKSDAKMSLGLPRDQGDGKRRRWVSQWKTNASLRSLACLTWNYERLSSLWKLLHAVSDNFC
jgi:hypothetical protein